MSERLYYDDSYLTEFSACVVGSSEDGCKLTLDRTAFYPASGGQPCDLGTISDIQVAGVDQDEDEHIVHTMAAPVLAKTVDCRVDWDRRFDHMQQHSGQHLLSAVILASRGIPTVSFHLGPESATIDIATGTLDARDVAEIELFANRAITENRAVTVEYRDAAGQSDLRVPSSRQGLLRIIRIEDLDVSACGGTHVRSTGEIGCLLMGRLDKMHGNVRIEFLCGMRAVRRARADYDALNRIARTLETAVAAAPGAVAAQQERIKESDQTCRRLSLELARRRGREIYESSSVAASGLRLHENIFTAGAIGDDTRAEAKSFTSLPAAVYIAASREASTLLLAVSAGAGIEAGPLLKKVLSAAGGRGGGNATMAQGSVADKEALDAALAAIRREVESANFNRG